MWQRVLGLLVLVYLLLVAILLGFQRRLIFHPTRVASDQAEVLARRVGAEPWRAAGSGQLMGWRWPAPAAPRVVLAFHGNAGMALDRGYLAALLGSRHLAGGAEVRVVEYPGFGPRPGEPSEASFFAAARAAFDDLRAADPRPIVLVGESIGSGSACHVAAQRPATAGLLLVTPFTRLADVAARHFPWLPVRWLLSERFDNVAALAGYKGPLATLLAGQDEVVPVELGRRLHDGYAGPRRLWIEERASHNGLDFSPATPRWSEITAFLQTPR